ncbi:pilus assembly protein [Mesorhizobium humile]|uniref:Pilus assembly protein n=1 Tax=Mesorhizobium humile TaxID=3072313 RepID=A0ABU4YGL2_9HYPH|nr:MULTISPECIES: pilus assembly protein [unclassified Mesorhizobium]MDX8460832.1 pilus assembly protein [Mesorhizobium sp. VK2D]MDX8485079.1 pilus assembly protein [Mesorhizobium sp. VK2B]
MLLRQFWRSRRGNFSLMLAVGVPAMLGAVAFATDVSTLMRAKSNLQNALDAANLASSHLGDAETTRAGAFDSYFQANVASHSELSNAKATLTVDRGVNFVKTKATASADVNLNFAFLFGAEKHISVDASAVESNNQLEVVLVLDNTGSMAGARITALRTASKSLLDYLEAVKSPTRSVRASLVPFVTAVNVNGPEFDPSWIDMDGKSSSNGVNFPVIDGKRPNHMALFKQLGQKGGWNNTGWKGCVEARPGALNIADTPPDPSKPDTLFVPYFAPDDPDVARKPSASYGNSSTGYNNSYLDDTIDNSKLNQNILGIDLSGLVTGLVNALLSADLKVIGKYVASTTKIITEAGNTITIGPNRACPTPIIPLTDDFDKLRLAASQMSEWNGSGTNVSEGLAWGQRVLSPQPPYTDAAPYKTAGVTKVVMLLTDGENVVYGASNTPQKSDYTSYGYLASGRFGSSNQTTAARNVDGWTKNVCAQLKSQGVQIYTMVLQADTAANRSLYSACASDPSDYYAVEDPAKLPNVFQSIANKFSRLQLTN